MNRNEKRMRIGILLFMVIFLSHSFCHSQDDSKRNRKENVFVDNINDSIPVQVNLQYDEKGLPVHYYCHVNTPVCEHGLCKLMVIDVYWDMLGNFLKYELPPNESLTKFDHLEFTKEDHHQLYGILSDKASILRDYPVEDLIDNRTQRKSEVVDAVSSATSIEVKDAIVGGAVYSTYTLWHIVNGPIASRIGEYTKPLFNEALLIKMFNSNNFYYQFFALNNYPEEETVKYIPYIINLVKNGLSYIPYFAIEKIPMSVWATNQYQVSLLKHFSDGDFELQNAFLNKITGINLCTEALDMLIYGMRNTTDKQLIKELDVINYNLDRLSQGSVSKIAEFSNHHDRQISEQTNLLLKSLEEKDKNKRKEY